MSEFVMPLMLVLDTSSLTMSLVNIASPAGAERTLADAVEAALRPLGHLRVERVGDSVIARTTGGRAERAVVVATLATPSSEPHPLAHVEMGRLFGPGASDAKGALAVTLKAAAAGGHAREVTFAFLADAHDTLGDALAGDAVLLARPTGSAVVGADLDHQQVRRLVALTDEPAVAVPVPGGDRFAVTGRPVIAFGPGDPTLAGTPQEFVPTAQLSQCEFALRQWLTT